MRLATLLLSSTVLLAQGSPVFTLPEPKYPLPAEIKGVIMELLNYNWLHENVRLWREEYGVIYNNKATLKAWLLERLNLAYNTYPLKDRNNTMFGDVPKALATVKAWE